MVAKDRDRDPVWANGVDDPAAKAVAGEALKKLSRMLAHFPVWLGLHA